MRVGVWAQDSDRDVLESMSAGKASDATPSGTFAFGLPLPRADPSESLGMKAEREGVDSPPCLCDWRLVCSGVGIT